MEKDKLPEWLKGQAKQFELIPQQGSFDVLMRKREQQRKQRKLLVWLSMSAVVAMIMSVGIWFTAGKTEQVATMEQQATQEVPLSKDESGNDQLRETDSRKATNQTPEITSAKTSQPVSNDIPASATNTPSPDKKISVKQAISPISTPSVKTIGIQQTKTITTRDVSKPIENTMLANAAVVPSTSPVYPDSISIKALVPDSIETIAAQDTIKQSPGDPSMELLSIKPAYKQSYWSITGVFTPQFINGAYNTNSFASLSWMKKYIENREQNDKAQYGFNAGMKVERTFGKHWSISTGLLYSMVKFEEIKILDPVPPDTPVTLGLVSDKKIMYAVAENQNRLDISFSSLEIPLQVAYRLNHKNMYYQVTAGVSYAYLFQTRSLIFDEKDSLLNVKETNDAGNGRLNQHSVLLLGGINVGYFFSKRWSCYAGPVYRYSLNTLYNKDYFIGPQPYYLGLELGIKYSFR